MRTMAWAPIILGMSLMLSAESSAMDRLQNYRQATPARFKSGQYKQTPEGVKRLSGVEVTDAETHFKRGLSVRKTRGE